ncbi:MAG: biotin transporter BioY [Christensenellaceae bacterium]|jgi:biotin transport system substrate-specific component
MGAGRIGKVQNRQLATRGMVLCALFAALIAVGAFIRIPLPGPLTFSMQTMFVALAGMLLGKKFGVLSIAIYVGLGLCGLPIFSKGYGGPGYILEPSFGFLIGFFLHTWLTAYLTEKAKDRPTIKKMILVQLPGLFLMYAIALPYFYLISNFYLQNGMGVDVLMTTCFLWMMPGEAAKCLLAAWLANRLLLVLHKTRQTAIGRRPE